jgi:hypothetical protein
MSSHPGSTLNDAVELALCLKRHHYAPEQVQDYYPTPGTASTVMYYTGINPLDGKNVYVATDYHEKQLQRALLQYNRPENAPLVREALIKAGREDLIGFGPECLVRPERENFPQKPQNGMKKPTGGRRGTTVAGGAQNKRRPTAQKDENRKNTPQRGKKTTQKPTGGKPHGNKNAKRK